MKRVSAIILSVVLLMALLPGCVPVVTNNAPATPAPNVSKGSDDGLIPSAYGGVSVSAPGVLPIVKEPVELSIMIAQHANVEGYDNNKMTLYMEQQTGVDIKWVIVPDQDATQRVNLVLASQVDIPDVFMVTSSSGSITNEVVSDMADQGMFLQLDDMIAKHAYWYAERRAQDPLIEKLMKLPDGHEYTMPKTVLSEPNAMSRRAWINQKWLDNLGLKTPTTTDELLTVLKAFKDGDPNGNNKADEIAFMGSKNGWSTLPEEFILNSFVKFSRGAPYYLDNGKFEAAYDKDAYREGLKYMNKLCAVEGLLDPASYTQDDDQLKQLFDNVDNALVGLATGGGTFLWAPMDGDRVKEYAPLAPLKGPGGVQYTYYDPFGSYYLNEFIITSACKNPEVAFKFADFMYSREVSMRNRLGEPVVDYAIPSNNEMGIDGKPATYNPILVWGKINSSHWNEIGPTYNDFDNNGIKGPDPYELQQYLWNATLDYYAPYKPPVEMCHNSKIYFKADEARRLSEIDTDLKSFIRSALAEFVTGVRNPNDDKQWDAYLNELKALGYEEYISINQARYDSMK